MFNYISLNFTTGGMGNRMVSMAFSHPNKIYDLLTPLKSE